MPLNGVRNPSAGKSIAVGIHRMGHGCIGLGTLQQFGRHAEDILLFRAGQPDGSGGDGLRDLALWSYDLALALVVADKGKLRRIGASSWRPPESVMTM